jgi:uncharacterized membrane protein (Fun14 family)
MVAANETTQRLSIFQPTGMFGLGLIAGFAAGFSLVNFCRLRRALSLKFNQM